MATNYTTRTASLRATIADVRVLDAKKMKLDGKNILDYISDSEFDSYDTRDPQLKNDELDIWNTAISLSDNGHIEVKPKEHAKSTISSTQTNTLKTAATVINNEVFDEQNEHLMYWQTDGLTDGTEMLFDCTALTTFSSDLSSLINGNSMFYGCYALTSFNADLSSLTDGIEMFFSCMFLESFSSNLSSLINGNGMFVGCTNLTTFSSDLSSLTNGNSMFVGCKLDAKSVANIIHTIKDTYNGEPLQLMTNITIGIGCNATEEDQLLFAQECDCETWEELLDEFALKNWGVEFQCNGRPTTTYNMRRGATLPIYTKLEEVIMPTDENERKPYYAYTSQDGSKFYNINYFHSTNGSTEGYDVFSSLEEAISTYNVTPKN